MRLILFPFLAGSSIKGIKLKIKITIKTIID